MQDQRTRDFAAGNVVAHGLGRTSINPAADGEGSSENLLHGTLERLGHGLEVHLARNVDDLVERDRLAVLDVLLLLAITGGLLEGLDHKRRRGGDDGDLGLTVLDGEADGNPLYRQIVG